MRGLRAAAVAASEAGESKKAASLWSALAELQGEDDLAQFNAGYWAQDLAEQLNGPESVIWLRQAGERYARVLKLKPDDPTAAYNWGTALDAEARTVVGSDLGEARRLWREAGAKYVEALRLKPDYHAAAKNWGNALLREAGTLLPQKREQVSLLVDQAERVLLEHADQVPGLVAYNLACVYGHRGDVPRCLQWLQTAQTHKTLPGCVHLRTDRDLDVVRTAPEFQAWFQTVCPESTDV